MRSARSWCPSRTRALASVIAVIGIVFVARIITRHPGRLSSAIEYILHLPWILPTILIALGLVMAFDRPQALIGGKVLTGTVVLLLVAYIIIKLPFTLRLLKAAFASVPADLEDASRILGAGQLQTLFRVVVPHDPADGRGDHRAQLQQPARRLRRGGLPLPPARGAARHRHQALDASGEANLEAMSITFV